MKNIVIVGLTNKCKPCAQVKKALDDLKIPYTFYDIKQRGSPELRALKKEMTKLKHTTIPAVWIDGEFIGGKKVLLEKLQLS